ncbi:MAG: hypothetical protein V7L00_28645 [Nostoc sp.]|uniref:hypothetical protein n=1 Tax=Nostoc sp. TaxID=1180 RepID=UPI002FFB4449
MTQNSKTGAAFIASGTIAGAGLSATVGRMGLAGGFGAVGIGTTPVVVAGAVAGAAAYGAKGAVAPPFKREMKKRGFLNSVKSQSQNMNNN